MPTTSVGVPLIRSGFPIRFIAAIPSLPQILGQDDHQRRVRPAVIRGKHASVNGLDAERWYQLRRDLGPHRPAGGIRAQIHGLTRYAPTDENDCVLSRYSTNSGIETQN